MSEDWMTDRMNAGDKIVARILEENGSPVHPGVELGRAAGRLAATFHKLHGEAAAQGFLQTMVSVFNLETYAINSKREILYLRFSRDPLDLLP